MDTFREAVRLLLAEPDTPAEAEPDADDSKAATAYPEKLTSGYYRVRRSWEDKKSQVGAYRILANAKAAADKDSGTFVFSNDGAAIYPTGDCTPGAAVYRIHTVIKGDTLWDLARKYLGDGSRYPEIKTLNGLSSDVIRSGWKLKIPN